MVTQEGCVREVDQGDVIKLCGFLLPHQRVRLGSCWALSSFVVGIGLCFLPFAFDSMPSCCSLSLINHSLTAAPTACKLDPCRAKCGTTGVRVRVRREAEG